MADFEASATKLGIELMPWQREAGRYIYALNADDNWLYPEVAVIVARRNGKTELLLPLIMDRLRRGRRIIHAAQGRDLPRKFFYMRLIPEVQRAFGMAALIRKAAGQETIEIISGDSKGGSYTIVAGTGGAPRGLDSDDILLDEVRELGPEFVDSGVRPTNFSSPNPQTIFLSNAGSEDSIALNTIRLRAAEDPALAWLEWSADPNRAVDDPVGWAESNPALGHVLTIDSLSRLFVSYKLAGTLAAFETEHLCRWVTTTRERLVDDFDWASCKGEVGPPSRPALAVSLDPDGQRASVAMAWRADDGVIEVSLPFHETSAPIDTDRAGEVLRKLQQKHAARVGYDPLTDAELMKYVKKGKAESITGQKYAAASSQFSLAVAGQRIRYADADAITDDLTWTARKPDGNDGSYHAVRAKDDHPITASLAAVRAVWLASQPQQRPPRVY